MEVKQNGKTLWHIQNLNMGSDGAAFDCFVWSDHEPTREDLVKAHHEEFSGCDDEDYLLDEFLTSSEVYKVYAEEV